MKHIVLIACCKSKLAHSAPAESLYTSTLFKFSLAYARTLHPDAIYILSAKHGLVPLDQQLEPYEQTLKKMNRPERLAWGQKVLSQLAQVCHPSEDRFTILAGRAYYDTLTTGLPNHELPLLGLGQGKRLQFLKQHIPPARSPADQAPKIPQ
jgi:hypothetical protein